DKARGRDESRTVTVFDPAGKLDDSDWKSLVSAIIRVERVVYTRSSRTGLLSRATEIAFYVSNKPLAAIRAAQAIRAHWRIETTSHHSRDVTFGEDRSRIRLKSRRVRAIAQLWLQHPQGKSNRHAQPGPLPRRSRRLRRTIAARQYLALNSHGKPPALRHGPRVIGLRRAASYRVRQRFRILPLYPESLVTQFRYY